MTRIQEIGAGRFRVEGFVESMPHLVYVVLRESCCSYRVVGRQGATDTTWDKHAIDAVRSFLTKRVTTQ